MPQVKYKKKCLHFRTFVMTPLLTVFLVDNASHTLLCHGLPPRELADLYLSQADG